MNRIAQPLPVAHDRNICPQNYVKVPEEDVQKLIRAWRERIGGQISVSVLLELFERWEGCGW